MGVTKWVSGDVYEIKATAESTNGSLGFIDARVPPTLPSFRPELRARPGGG